jgi:hypothetical protein
MRGEHVSSNHMVDRRLPGYLRELVTLDENPSMHAMICARCPLMDRCEEPASRRVTGRARAQSVQHGSRQERELT